LRKKLIAGNWKMNLDRSQAIALSKSLAAGLARISAEVELLLCPSYVYLEAVGQTLRGSPIGLGGQDVYFQNNGAFTGEISTSQLLDLGCRYAILGHSERRQIIGETDSLINQKIKACLQAGLTPILCVGELLEEREAGQTMQVVERQFTQSMAGIDAEGAARIVVAYEPVWAIGTGKTASPEQAQEVHSDLRKLVAKCYNSSVAEKLRILYGGSVKPENAAELLGQPDIDGALIGGASLNSDSFLAIAEGATGTRV
jgi:triosephosphate isomerase